MKTGIEINTGFFPLAWFLYFVTPIIVIEGVQHTRKWGTSYFEVAPGEYTVEIYFPYMWKSVCGANQITIDVEEGETRGIKYYMPPWMFAKGSINAS